MRLYRPRTETQPDDALTATSTQEYLLAYLQWLDADRAGSARCLSRRASRRRWPATASSASSAPPTLEAAVVWMFRSFSRVGELVPVVLSILERRLRAGAVLAPLADAGDAGPARPAGDLGAGSAPGHRRAGSRRAVPLLRRARCSRRWWSAEYDATERILDAVEADPVGPGREEAIAAPGGLSPPAARGAAPPLAARDRHPDFRKVLLEVYARRYYRIRELRNLRFDEHDGQLLCAADYDWENKHIHLVVAYAELARLPEMAHGRGRAPRPHAPEDRQVIVDLATWRDGARTPRSRRRRPVVEELLAAVRLRSRAVAGGRHRDHHRRRRGRARPHACT